MKRKSKMSSIKKIMLLGVIATALAGCSVNPTILIREEAINLPEKFSVKKDLIKNSFSDEEKKSRMKNWWAQFNSPELLEIIEHAQKNSPTIGAAAFNIKNYETILISNKSKTKPNLGLSSSTSRYNYTGSNGPYNTSTIGLHTSWELDLFNRNSLETDANKKQIESAKAMWHDAQTLVAAEAARNYFNYQFCKKTLNILREDYEARKRQNDITNLKVKAGFEAEISFYQNEAGLSHSKSTILAQEAQCDTEIKSMVALTAMNEEKLKTLLDKEVLNLEKLNLYIPVSVPGDLLNQRPDVLTSINNVRIAALYIEKAKSDKLPSISISGDISSNLSISNTLGISKVGNTWSIGPLNINLPIFDGGVIEANQALYESKYEQEKLELATNLRNAIKEVEVAMINLSTSNQRSTLNNKSVENYKKAYDATTETYKAGLASLFNLEDARRDYLSEVNNQLNNELERLNAWINLYKAVGGGFKKIEEKNE